jgi:hypothetical protein
MSSFSFVILFIPLKGLHHLPWCHKCDLLFQFASWTSIGTVLTFTLMACFHFSDDLLSFLGGNLLPGGGSKHPPMVKKKQECCFPWV